MRLPVWKRHRAADLGRRLVLAQAVVNDLPQQVVVRPGEILTSATSASNARGSDGSLSTRSRGLGCDATRKLLRSNRWQHRNPPPALQEAKSLGKAATMPLP